MNNTSWSQDRLVVICNWWCRQMKFLSVPSFGEIYVRSNSTKVWFDSFECTVANEVAIVVLPSSSSSFQAIAIAMRSIVAKKMHLNRKYVDRNDVLTFSGLGGGDNDDGDGVGDPDNHNGMFSLSPLGRVFVPWLECGCHLPYNNPPPSKSYGDPVYTITHLPRATPSCRGGHPCRQWIRKFPAHTIAPPPKRSHCQKRKANFTLNFDKDREPTILCRDPCRWSTCFPVTNWFSQLFPTPDLRKQFQRCHLKADITIFSCPGQLNKWQCRSVCLSEPTNNQSLGSIKEWP